MGYEGVATVAVAATPSSEYDDITAHKEGIAVADDLFVDGGSSFGLTDDFVVDDHKVKEGQITAAPQLSFDVTDPFLESGSVDCKVASGQAWSAAQNLLAPAVPPTTDEIEAALEWSKLHVTTLSRGELWLTPEEVEKINLVLENLDGTFSFAFHEAPDVPSPRGTPSAGGSKKSGRSNKRRPSSHAGRRSSAGRSSVGSGGGASASAGTSQKSRQRSRSGDRSSVGGSASGETFAQRIFRASQSQMRLLPEWTRRLHRIAVLLCQSDVAKPFLHDPTESVCPDACGLITIVTKLEQGFYLSQLDAFNDIYTVWLSAYRLNPPGSDLWIKAHEASRLFFQQVANAPLSDDFSQNQAKVGSRRTETDAGGLGGVTLLNGASSLASSPSRIGTRHRSAQDAQVAPSAVMHPTESASVDNLLKEFFQLKEPKAPEPPSAQTPPQSHRKRLPPARSSTGASRSRTQTPAAPVTDDERELFQTYLSQLEAHHHLMLFEAYRRSAVWRSVESGEVELDDARTPPPIFRKMLAWCRSQIAVRMSRMAGGGKLVPELPNPSPAPMMASSAVTTAAPEGATPAASPAVQAGDTIPLVPPAPPGTSAASTGRDSRSGSEGESDSSDEEDSSSSDSSSQSGSDAEGMGS